MEYEPIFKCWGKLDILEEQDNPFPLSPIIKTSPQAGRSCGEKSIFPPAVGSQPYVLPTLWKKPTSARQIEAERGKASPTTRRGRAKTISTNQNANRTKTASTSTHAERQSANICILAQNYVDYTVRAQYTYPDHVMADTTKHARFTSQRTIPVGQGMDSSVRIC